jgi:antitoxin PrlF
LPFPLFLIYSHYLINQNILKRMTKMARQAKTESCCSVEAVVAVDSRGQVVLPKELRSAAGIKAGDKLAVVVMQSGGKVCCLSLMKVDQLASTVKNILGPVARELAE